MGDTNLVINRQMKRRAKALKSNENGCHAHMREILSYLHNSETTSMFYIYEAIIVNKILMQVL